MDIQKTLFALSEAVSVGTLTAARDIAFDILSKYTDCEKCDNLTVIGKMKGQSDRTIMLDAHIDEIALVVTAVDENGFVTVAPAGGFDLRTLPAREVVIHGKTEIPAVFCSTPPHLSSGEITYDDINALKLDSMLGEKARDVITPGDLVTLCTKPAVLSGTRVTGKSLDDRAGVVCLLELAERLHGKTLPTNVVFVLSDAEELGMRGCKTAAFKVDPDEAIAIDVSFADAPDVSPDDCGKMSGGAMIGVSPTLDREISDRLNTVAFENNIPYQNEIMGGRTGTNSDVIGITRGGVRTGVVSIPLRNMHTDCEVIDLKDIKSVCDILELYILSGGVENA